MRCISKIRFQLLNRWKESALGLLLHFRHHKEWLFFPDDETENGDVDKGPEESVRSNQEATDKRCTAISSCRRVRPTAK